MFKSWLSSLEDNTFCFMEYACMQVHVRKCQGKCRSLRPNHGHLASDMSVCTATRYVCTLYLKVPTLVFAGTKFFRFAPESKI